MSCGCSELVSIQLFGCSAAPLAWLGQVTLSYGVSARICYPADHPIVLSTNWLFAVLVAFDLVALALCGAGAWVWWEIWQRVRGGEGRNYFLALWGLMSSLWFLAAVLFNVIASLVVPSCPT